MKIQHGFDPPEKLPSCDYECDVMENCIYHHVQYNKEHSLSPKYSGERGCKFFRPIIQKPNVSDVHGSISYKHGDRFLDIVGEH